MIKGQVTCICITYNRLDLLMDAIAFFLYQTHCLKDLIVVFQSNDNVTKEYVLAHEEFKLSTLVFFDKGNLENYKVIDKRKADSAIHFIEIPFESKISLGAKRNLAVELALGEYVCMWDDDDWYPKTRIENQLRFMNYSFKDACTLASILLHNRTTHQFYVTGLRPEGWEGTLLCKKSVIGRYDDLNKREDTPVIHELQRKNMLCVMEEPELYVYNAHHDNVSGNDHFNLIVKYALSANTIEYPEYHDYILTKVIE